MCSKSLYEIRAKRDVIKSEGQQNKQNRGKYTAIRHLSLGCSLILVAFPENYHRVFIFYPLSH